MSLNLTSIHQKLLSYLKHYYASTFYDISGCPRNQKLNLKIFVVYELIIVIIAIIMKAKLIFSLLFMEYLFLEFLFVVFLFEIFWVSSIYYQS